MSLSDRLFGYPQDRFAAAGMDALHARGQSGVYIADDFRIDVARPEEGVYPERYRVGGWPDTETMALLVARAEEP